MKKETKIRIVAYLIFGVLMGIFAAAGVQFGAIPIVLMLAGTVAVTEGIVKWCSKDGNKTADEASAPAPSAPVTSTPRAEQKTDARTIQCIAEQFMVTLTSEQINIIMHSSLPFIESLAVFLPKGIPDSIDFKYKLSKKCAEIVEYIKNHYDARVELASVNRKISIFTDEEIAEIIEENAPKKGYLQGTVNYQEIALYLLRQESENASEKLAVFPPEMPAFVTNEERPQTGHNGNNPAYNECDKSLIGNTAGFKMVCGSSIVFCVFNLISILVSFFSSSENVKVIFTVLSLFIFVATIAFLISGLDNMKSSAKQANYDSLLACILTIFSVMFALVLIDFLIIMMDKSTNYSAIIGMIESVILAIILLCERSELMDLKKKGD